MNIKENWVDADRNTRIVTAIVVVILLAVSLLSIRCNPVVGSESVLGLVLEIEAEGIEPLDEGPLQSRVLMAVADSTEIHILLPPPVPRPGDFVRLIAEHYHKGNIEYHLDLEAWNTEEQP